MVDSVPDSQLLWCVLARTSAGIHAKRARTFHRFQHFYGCLSLLQYLRLNDGLIYHFSLTTQDQLNLITLQSMIASGETAIPYHADGELCRYYTVEDISTVMDAATAHKTFHVTYFNSLKAYINSMDSIVDISKIEYGDEIPDEYQSDILKSLYASQNGEAL